MLLKALRGLVGLFCTCLLFYQVYLSLAEYQKHEYVQVPEDSSLSEVTLPRIVVCNGKGFKEKVNMSLFTGMDPIYAKQKPNFFGWSKKDMTTKDHLESLVTLHTKSQLFFKALLAKSMMSFGNQIEDQKLRISYHDGQCFSITIPKKEGNKTKELNRFAILLFLNKDADAKIYLQDPNRFNGYYNLAEALPLDQSTYVNNFEVTLAETKMDPRDPKITCVDYDKFDSFLECSDKKAEERFYPILGCVPPWFTDDQEKVCQQEDTDRIIKQESASGEYWLKIAGKREHKSGGK